MSEPPPGRCQQASAQACGPPPTPAEGRGHWRESRAPLADRQNRGDSGRLCHDFATLHPGAWAADGGGRGLLGRAQAPTVGADPDRGATCDPDSGHACGAGPAGCSRPAAGAIPDGRPPRSRSRPTWTAYPWARAGGLIGAVDNVWTTVGKSATRCRFGTAGRRGQIGCVQPARPCRSALRPYPRAHLAGPGATFGAGEGSQNTPSTPQGLVDAPREPRWAVGAASRARVRPAGLPGRHDLVGGRLPDPSGVATVPQATGKAP
jgi:hypothetical protein